MQKNNEKIQLNEATEAIVGMAEDVFNQDMPLKDLRNIFQEMNYGEIVIKVIKGKIESIHETRHYKPIVDKNP